MKAKLLLILLFVFSMTNAQTTWDFKTGTEGWANYGDDVSVSHDGSENLVLTYTGGVDGVYSYTTIYNPAVIDVANINFFNMKFAATNWPKASVLFLIQFTIGGTDYYATKTISVVSGTVSFNLRTETEHTWSVLPASGTTSQIRIEIPHNSELAGSNWNGAILKIDKISFLKSLSTNLNEKTVSDYIVYPNPVSESFRIKGDKYDKLSIFDAAGRFVKEFNTTSTSNSVLDFPKGLYFLKIESEGATIIKKLSLQ